MAFDNADVLICGLSAVAMYMFLASLFEHKKVKFMHQTGVAIIIGFFIGMFAYFLFNDFFVRLIQVNNSLVFYGLLPPMLFADGYNLKKRRFFQNLYYINIYGLFGTILHFLTFVGLLYAVSALGLIRDTTDFSKIRYLETWQILLFSACLCSIDNIASLSQIKPEYQPKIFSIIFGQSLFKDSITIVLFKSIQRLVITSGSTDQFIFYWYTPFVILATFLVIILVSILIGFVFAIVLTLIFKHARFLVKDKGVTEVGLIFLTGYIAYLASELAGFSGVISMLFCGITLSHFNTYNMSSAGTQAAKVTFETVALIAEGFLFLVLGIVSWQFEGDSSQGVIISESVTFISCCVIIMFVARFVNIYMVTWMFRPCKGESKWRLNSYELQIIYASGMVKGAVPFALITSTTLIGQTNSVTSLMIKSTVIVLVFFTSVFFNAILPVLIRNRKQHMRLNVQEGHPSLFDSLIEKEREAMKEQGGESPESKRYKSKSQKYWKKFDQGILKPFLIFNYANRKVEIKEQKKRQRMEEIHIVFESEDDLKKGKTKGNILDPLNEDRNVFVEVKGLEEERQDEESEREKRKLQKQEEMRRKAQKAKERNRERTVTFEAEIPTRHAMSAVADGNPNSELFSSQKQVESLCAKIISPSNGVVSPQSQQKGALLSPPNRPVEESKSKPKKFQ